MSATILTPQLTTRSGISLTDLASAADGVNGNRWANTGAQTLVVVNGGGSPCVVTIVYGVGGTIDGQAVTNRTVSVPAGKTYEIGPFPTNLDNDINGYANVTFNQASSVTVLVRQLGS